MLKWAGTAKGNAVLGFGLDAENVKRLKAGSPIYARVTINGVSVNIVIHYGETKEKMLADIKEAGIAYIPQTD